jgi:hypothetical protein
MADVILRLRVDPVTGKRELVIDYTSDADALPVEHEQAHRELADRVVDGGLRGAGVEVARETAPVGEAGAAQEPEAGGEVAPVAQPAGPHR